MKLSIIVPVYNLENYIARTLDSLLSIRFSHDYEVIVVNDGSTDASAAIIAGYQEKTDNIHLYTIENRGAPGARNYGISKAAGEYITFVDGDDTVDPDFFEKAVDALDSGGYDFVQGNFRLIYENREDYWEYVDRDTELSGRKEMLGRYLDVEHTPIGYGVCGKVFPGEIVRRVCFNPALKYGEDLQYVFDVLLTANKIKLLKDVSIHYFQRETSIVHTMNVEKAFSKLEVIQHLRDKNPYPEFTPLIDYRQLLTLQELYYLLNKEKDPRAKGVQREILRSPVRQMWPQMSLSSRRRYLLHRFAGPVYQFYFRHIKR